MTNSLAIGLSCMTTPAVIIMSCVVFQAAELMAGKYRQDLNATTMLGQSKTVIQAEIDSAAELIDFIR